MRKTTTEEPSSSVRPYGMQFLQPPRQAVQPRPDGVRYSPELQLTVGADGNPWKTEAMASETSSNNDGDQVNEDTQSDPY
jgi:putative ATP-grasp target RiPP